MQVNLLEHAQNSRATVGKPNDFYCTEDSPAERKKLLKAWASRDVRVNHVTLNTQEGKQSSCRLGQFTRGERYFLLEAGLTTPFSSVINNYLIFGPNIQTALN